MDVEGHVIVCGLGHVGVRIAELCLDLGIAVTCVTTETRDEWVRNIEARGGRVIRGDARDEARLAEAGLDAARAVIAATDDDLVNVEVAMDARERSKVPIVVRVFDEILAEELEASFDVRRALAVSALAAPMLATSALGESARAAFVLGETRWLVHDGGDRLRCVSVPKKAAVRLPGVRFRDLLRDLWGEAPRPLRRALWVLLAVVVVSVAVFHFGMGLSVLDAAYFIIATVTTTGYGDVTAKGAGAGLEVYACGLMILGSASTAIIYSLLTNVLVAARLGTSQRTARAKRHVIVVGLDRVGYRVAAALLASGVPVVGVTRGDDNGDLAASASAIVPVVVGDARRPETLERAGIAGARAVIACTHDDANNVAITLRAKRIAPKIRAVLRAFDAAFARKLRAQAAIDAAFSTSALAAPVFVAAALYEGVRAAFVHDGELVAITEHPIDRSVVAGELATALGGTPLLARGAKTAFASADEKTALSVGGSFLIVRRSVLRGAA